MSGGGSIYNPLGSIKKLASASLHPVRTTKKLLGIKKPPDAPEIPTVDEARQNQQVSDRIRRRRGVYANIYGGASQSAPNAGAKTLLGN